MIAICKECNGTASFVAGRQYKYVSGEFFMAEACTKCCIENYAKLVSK